MLPKAFLGMHYVEFLPKLVKHLRATCYLEIGVNRGDLLSAITVERAIGVDPYFVISQNVAAGKQHLLLRQETSDDFFLDKVSISQFFGERPVDIAFLDGMHNFEFLLRDFFNAEAMMHKNGMIVMHDCLALDGNMINRSQEDANRLTIAAGKNVGWWTGDVWKIVPILQEYRPDLKLYFLDCHPTGIVCATHLDPTSTILQANYDQIIDNFLKINNGTLALEEMYAKINIETATTALFEGKVS